MCIYTISADGSFIDNAGNVTMSAYSHSLHLIYIYTVYFKLCERRLGMAHAAVWCSWELCRETSVSNLGWCRCVGWQGANWPANCLQTACLLLLLTHSLVTWRISFYTLLGLDWLWLLAGALVRHRQQSQCSGGELEVGWWDQGSWSEG